MKEKPADLELFSDGDLIDELRRRFEHMVFAGMKPNCSDGNRYTYGFEGNFATIVGLAHWAAANILAEFKEESEMFDEEEDD